RQRPSPATPSRPTRRSSELEGQWASTTTYGDYDNKHATGRHGNPYRWKFNSPNNHRSEKTTSTYDGGNLERTLKYTYNNEGYPIDRKSTRLNSSHVKISYAV